MMFAGTTGGERTGSAIGGEKGYSVVATSGGGGRSVMGGGPEGGNSGGCVTSGEKPPIKDSSVLRRATVAACWVALLPGMLSGLSSSPVYDLDNEA